MIDPIKAWASSSSLIQNKNTPESLADGFKTILGQALEEVNSMQLEADHYATAFAAGVSGVDIHDVTISSEKAQLALSLTIEVRNKMIEAYQELMRMQV